MENMKSKEKDMYTIDLIKYVRILLKYKYWITGIVIASAIVCIFFMSSLFIKPLYKSSIAFYPNNVLQKSDETPSKQVMFWCKSKDIKDSIINKYNFKERYKLSDSKNSAYGIYDRNIKFSLDKFYGNITVNVMDIDPEIACQIANDIPKYINIVMESDLKKSLILNLNAYKEAIDKKNIQIDTTIKKLISYGVDYEIIMQTLQGNEVTKGYLGTSDGSKFINKEAVNKMKTNIEKTGPIVYTLQQELSTLISQRSDLQSRYDAVSVGVLKKYNFLSIGLHPDPDYSKAYPNTYKTTVIISVFSFFVSCLFFILLDTKCFHFIFQFLFYKKKNAVLKQEENGNN